MEFRIRISVLSSTISSIVWVVFIENLSNDGSTVSHAPNVSKHVKDPIRGMVLLETWRPFNVTSSSVIGFHKYFQIT